MRADRLVATLLILQNKGTATAAEIAAELEISERTARRDLEALAMSGVPVYSRAGRGGGWSLVGGARTDLSGLSAAEARALFLVAGPSSSASPALKAALRKLVQALPEPFRADAEAAAGAVVVDPSGWGQARPQPEPEFLDTLQQAVVDNAQIQLGYNTPTTGLSTRVVHPYGLVTKRAVWYLVAGTDKGQRTFRVSRVTSVAPTGEPAERPDDFDLDLAWRAATADYDERTRGCVIIAAVAPEVIGIVRRLLGAAMTVTGSTPAGWITAEIRAPSVRAGAGQLAGFGAHIEVAEPAEVRTELGRIGAELADAYPEPGGFRPSTSPADA